MGETLLMDVETLVYYGLDELGSRLWREIERCPNADEAFSRLKATTPLPADELAAKFRRIIEGLEASRIIVLVPGPEDL